MNNCLESFYHVALGSSFKATCIPHHYNSPRPQKNHPYFDILPILMTHKQNEAIGVAHGKTLRIAGCQARTKSVRGDVGKKYEDALC